MYTLHLARFVQMLGPPGPTLQKINAALHQKPISVIVHAIYWFFVLGFGAPVVGMALVWIATYQVIRHYVAKPRQLVPKEEQKQQQQQQQETTGQEKVEYAVIVTGCDTGIGKELVLQLAAEGFVVFAGCLDMENSKKNFACEPLIHPLSLDVTSDKAVQEAFQTVQGWMKESAKESNNNNKNKRVVHALVNNAGIARGGYLDWTTLSDYQLCMDTNLYGTIRMVKTFLPIFKQQKIDNTYLDARIINVNSIAGMLSGGGLMATPYEVSKNALEAFTDAIRLEMKMFDIKVISVNPSFHKTQLVTNMKTSVKKDTWDSVPDNIKKEYGEEFFSTYSNHIDMLAKSNTWDLNVVVETMLKDCIQCIDAPAQLLIGADARYAMVILRMFPQWFRHYVIQTLLFPQTPAMLSKPKKEEEEVVAAAAATNK